MTKVIARIVEFLAPRKPPKNSLEGEVLLQQQTVLTEMNFAVAMINLLLSTSVLMVVHSSAPLVWLGIWYAVIVGLSLILLLDWRHQKRKPALQKVSGGYMRRFENRTFAFGFIWGSASFLAAQASIGEQLVVMMLQISTYAGIAAW